MELKEAVRNLPELPGVYFMKDGSGTVIYVGKAKNLKARVSQYFQKNRNSSPKTKEMVEGIRSFDYTTTDTELEAFLLECRNIRELKPRYNRLLKNIKGYLYIKLTTREDYPVLKKVTHCKSDGSTYFGPFTSEGSVDKTLDFLKDQYPIRRCSVSAMGKKESACLNYHLGACLAPCRGTDIKAEYSGIISKIIKFLQGNDGEPLKNLKMKMKLAADALDFEKAASYRDQLRGVRHVLGKQKLVRLSSYGRNIIAVEKVEDEKVKLFLIKGNKLLYSESMLLSEFDVRILEEKLKKLAVDCFKMYQKDGKDCLAQEEIDEAQIIYSYLKGNKDRVQNFNLPSSRIGSARYDKIAGQILHKYDKEKFEKEK